MKAEFNIPNIQKAEVLFADNANFRCTVLPRLKLLYALKRELLAYPDFSWSFEFDHVNMNQNRLIISYLPSRNSDLNLFYEIPLVKKFELRAYLGNSSVHFIDIYNFLLENKQIEENQFTIRAEYRKIPHFILNLNVKRYQFPILQHYSSSKNDSNYIIDQAVQDEIKRNFDIFNSIFKFIVNRFRL